jgi:hypothetical protein
MTPRQLYIVQHTHIHTQTYIYAHVEVCSIFTFVAKAYDSKI